VPIAAKLSRKFYDRFGEDIANELVDLLNLIDTTYKSDLREINDINWRRIEARLDQLRAEVRGDLKDVQARLITWMFVFVVGAALLRGILSLFP
jgi:hypothetical protein